MLVGIKIPPFKSFRFFEMNVEIFSKLNSAILGEKETKQPMVCELCNVTCTGRPQFEQHVNGAKHKQKELQSMSTFSIERSWL